MLHYTNSHWAKALWRGHFNSIVPASLRKSWCLCLQKLLWTISFWVKTFFLWRRNAVESTQIPAASRWCLWTMDLFFLSFLYFPPMKQGLCASNYWACCHLQNRMKNAHDRANQSTWWQQSQAELMNPRLETQCNACDVTMAFVLCWWGSFQLSADLRVSRGWWQLSLVILLPAMISNVT